MEHKFFGRILEGKRVVISGSSSGLGLLMARRFLECGAKVAVMSAPFEEIDPVVADLKAIDPSFEVLGYRPELTDEVQVQNMLDDVAAHWGGIDVLVNNAGIYPSKEFEEYPKELFEKVFALNVTGVFVLTQRATAIMKKNEKGGSIINTSSMAGIAGAMKNIGYTASKFAVEGLTVGLARELGKYKIRVNAVAPAGMLKTDINGKPIDYDIPMDDEVKAKMGEIYKIAMNFAPMGTFSSHPDEEINAFIFLASDAAQFISGQTIAVSGACIWPAASPESLM